MILVLVDTLRRDRLGVHGSARELSPYMDRMATEGGPSPNEQIALGHRLSTARHPGEADLEDLVAFYQREAARFQADASAARALLARGEEEPAGADRAALTSVASVLLNLDATLTRE